MGVAEAVRVDVLGPLRLSVDGASVEVRGPKRRVVLALLALAEGRTVSVEQVVDALWPDDPPESARATVHSHVSRLRADLRAAAPRLTTDEGGYRLHLDDDGLDLRRVRDLRDRARDLVAADPATAAALLREARGSWRGTALVDLVEVPPLRAVAQAAHELWCDVTDRLTDALIAAGAAGEALGPAAEAVADDPLREPAVLLLVRALAATGQAPRALRTAREFRARLAEETGLDPSPALAALESDVAAGAAGPVAVPEIVVPAPPVPPVPSVPSDLHGRDRELAATGRLLTTERLVTVVGTGGVGKTRIARELARRHPDAATLMLAAITDAAGIPDALAAALRLGSITGDVLTACLDVLDASPRLLVLDNCEHLLDAVRDLVVELLERCPGVTLLTTSREPLGLAEEAVVRLAPLPDDAAVAVFLDRARRVRPDLSFSADELREVAEIVRRLEGLPLAVELAAGRLSTFAPAALALRLDRALDLLGSRALHARHRTLRATVAWSYDLLTDEEQRLFRHLSAFADGVDLIAVEGVATALGLAGDAGDLLARLVDASMVEVGTEPSGRTRYRLLETLRAFGRDRLVAAGEVDAADRHVVRWAVELAAWAERTALTAQEAVVGPVLRRELGNLRAAWRLARTRGDLDSAAAVAVSLAEIAYWQDLREVRALATELVDDPALAGHPFESRVWGHASHDAYLRGDAVEAERLARRGLARARDDEGRRVCLAALGEARLSRGAWDDAVTHDVAAWGLAERPRPEPGVGALAALYGGDPRKARELAALLPTGDVPSLLGLAAYVTAEIDSVEGRTDAAEEGYSVAMARARSVGSTFLEAIAAVGLASLRSRSGRIGAALVGYRDVIDHWAAGGNWSHQWVTLRNLADLLRNLGDAGTADLLDAAADRAPDAHDDLRGRGRVPPERAPDREQALVLARTAIARHLAGRDSAVHAG
ncbi:AfsR/SARP family transcriptional regulator [Actinomycetospora chibensis]|uniref:BTAD domain-containing putative transcriptional regulator n=1 Tax=Actinomycetospora chibensis TaxID=663606 RepID=A0ABV9RCM2_9PSEU|nr:BTAD domain-containing putative transcriptional regulator [Actinomycetospora chibensis]MDD7924076.1 BTAD domain-containing putative transcriptional regulator [Actinomycetospora chibensis]